MAVNSILRMYPTAPATTGVVRPRSEEGATDVRTPAGGTIPARIHPATTARPAVASNEVTVQPPPGTDPELWSILTQEEREHFARLGAMGPLTYGRVLDGLLTAAAVPQRGARLDVRA
ncbi:MAG: hypothetical protein AB1762_18165 [Gemmatimonadota bacterium]